MLDGSLWFCVYVNHRRVGVWYAEHHAMIQADALRVHHKAQGAVIGTSILVQQERQIVRYFADGTGWYEERPAYNSTTEEKPPCQGQ